MRGCRQRQKHQRSEPSIHFLIYARIVMSEFNMCEIFMPRLCETKDEKKASDHRFEVIQSYLQGQTNYLPKFGVGYFRAG